MQSEAGPAPAETVRGTPRRWPDIAPDPMDERVITHRRNAVNEARQPPISDRTTYLCALARAKRVLDIGVVDHNLESDRSDHWLHGRLAEVASEILGLDVLEKEVERLRDRGLAVECRDVTAGDLPPGPYDLIVAGEVLEHLDRPGSLFAAAAELLAPDGRLVLTTPNPYAIWRTFQNLRGRPQDNVDHVTLLSAWGIAEFAERSGLRLESFRGIATSAAGYKARLAQRLVRSGWLPLVPESVCESVLYEVVRLRSARTSSKSAR